jgi:hypothetical protein
MTTSSKMSHKVSPSTKVGIPAGNDLGSFRQTTTLNPSQANGTSPPKIPEVQRQLGEASPFRPDPNGVNNR